MIVHVDLCYSCGYVVCFSIFFFFKQKTAYEMRISDWSSDVCSSDLPENALAVCEASDYVGSTEYILRTVRASEPGDHWLIGTELNLVNRVADEMKDKGDRKSVV